MIKDGRLVRTLLGGYARILLDENNEPIGIRYAPLYEADKLTKEEIESLPMVTLIGNIGERKI